MAGLLFLVAGARAASKPLFQLTVQLDWVAEPEHGGFYQAQARGFFREEGLAVTLIPGGPNAFVMPSVATGKADVGQADSTNTLLQQAEGLPVVQFAAVLSKGTDLKASATASTPHPASSATRSAARARAGSAGGGAGMAAGAAALGDFTRPS